MRLLVTISFLLLYSALAAQHPITFFDKAEATAVKKDIARYPLLRHSFNEIKKDVDLWIGKDVDVPQPKDPAGGYTHERHKANYMLLFNSALLYNLTNDARYAKLVKDVLLKYAALNPTLQKHPQATSSSPGRLFWQALNDANWLVYSSMAFDLTRNAFTVAEIKTIESGAFKPEVEFITKDLKRWFDLLHNHGVWACAGVGLAGLATGNKEYVDMALYGTDKNGKSGFIAQMDNLFAPDGYYAEGPYYVRYAILPFYLFANALEHARPELKIFEHRNRILRRALHAGLQQTNLDGRFFPLNDAIKEKDFTTNEMVTALSIAWAVYGKDPGLLPVAKKQNRVLLNKGGAGIAAAIAQVNVPIHYPYESVEYTDGVDGKQGGLSLIRHGTGDSLSTLIFKYTSHGLSHGHFDRLNMVLYDKGNEILTDYGSVRFVAVEQKYGGRYLPENDAYASQTIAHNTIVVDETSHFNADEKLAGQHHPVKLHSSLYSGDLQAASAMENNAYKDVQLRRGLYFVEMHTGQKLIVDIFSAVSGNDHQYDLPFHYNGQLISTSFKYDAFTNSQEPLGKRNGYQFLWKEASAAVRDTLVQCTFLNDKTYYTISSLVQDSAQLFFARSGANDPNFNLRREPCFIIRKKGKTQTFVNIVEVHGKLDPVLETSSSSAPSVRRMRLLRNDEQFTVTGVVMADGFQWVLVQCNDDFSYSAKRSITIQGIVHEWTGGPFIKIYDPRFKL
ncbi:MAG TPA: heparinase II/III family protein [Chitinophagaceae bacterium]|nr:heparinase II/III family protein [Chitinophagaceae bacterium]